MVSSTLTAQPSNDAVRVGRRMDDLSVAHTLLGVSPSGSKPKSNRRAPLDSYAGLESLAEQAHAVHQQESVATPSVQETSPATTKTRVPNSFEESPEVTQPVATASTGLDALAALASKEAIGTSDPFLFARHDVLASAPNSSDEESDQMPPPPPRRRRSASNPEGMEKWDSLNRARGGGGTRRHFVLPESILEEELAEANAAVRERELLKSEDKQKSSNEDRTEEDRDAHEDEEENNEADNEEGDEEEEVDESMLTPEELLRKARSRLLEDLSEGSINGEKGQLMLPHALGKYKHVYNKNGRTGIYTAAERAAIIARFNAKRQRRVWNKKIRYGCRKNLADRRLRVKGRFVKRSEQEQLARELQARVEQKVAEDVAPENSEEDDKNDADMPDVSDPEAGFDPTDDQPYRRLRRYTIT